MPDLFLVPVAIVYLLVVGLLFIYGVNFLYMTWLSFRLGRRQLQPPTITEWPAVTVQLPIYNEMYVAERLIEAAARLEYPTEQLEIQVLDDSTDETAQIVAKTVERFRAQGVNIQMFHRPVRTGYKAGALAEGLERASSEFMAIFDADFIPKPDFLRRTIPFFYMKREEGDRPIAFIQARWGHVNRDYSLLTFLQSLAIDAHFMVEQMARSGASYWFNFNGTAGVWRRQAIIDAGGWRAETLTEDLDLSYRAYLKGWCGFYLRDVEVPAELPASFNAYRRQQHRWARGSFECAVRLIPQVLNAPISLSQKVEAVLHLTGYVVHLLLFALSLLYPIVLLLSVRYPSLISLFGIAILFNVTAFAPTIFFLAAQKQLGRKWWRQLPFVLFISAAGAGMMLNTVRAAIQGVRGTASAFERTPKFGVSNRGDAWHKRRYQLRLDRIVYLELALAALNGMTIGLAVYLQNWLIAIYAAIFLIGLLYTSSLSILQTITVQRSQGSERKS